MSIVRTLTRGLAMAASIVLAPFTLAAPTDFDREFVTRASAANEAEVAMARAAATRTNNAGVRVFAKKMIEDHSKANAALGKLASAQGLKLSPLTPEQRSALKKLEGLKGEKFDQEYARIQQRSHAEAMLLFKRQAGGPGAPALKQYAAAALPTLEAHYHWADALPGGIPSIGKGSEGKGTEEPPAPPAGEAPAPPAEAPK